MRAREALRRRTHALRRMAYAAIRSRARNFQKIIAYHRRLCTLRQPPPLAAHVPFSPDAAFPAAAEIGVASHLADGRHGTQFISAAGAGLA